MRRWFIPALLATLLVAGCGTGSNCSGTANPPSKAVVEVGHQNNIFGTSLDCDPTLKSLELGVGKQFGPSSEYSIKETLKKDGYGASYQDSVDLHVQPPAGTQVLGAIVFSPKMNAQLTLRVMSGETADFVLKTR